MFTKEMINDYADKLLIGLNDEECNTLIEEFDVIKENMDIIASIPGIRDVKPMSYPTEYKISSLREDTYSRVILTNDVIKNSAGALEDVISVPKVVA